MQYMVANSEEELLEVHGQEEIGEEVGAVWLADPRIHAQT